MDSNAKYRSCRSAGSVWYRETLVSVAGSKQVNQPYRCSEAIFDPGIMIIPGEVTAKKQHQRNEVPASLLGFFSSLMTILQDRKYNTE
ncbi:hypothetical protein AgCh_006907 [Apium graveolens]